MGLGCICIIDDLKGATEMLRLARALLFAAAILARKYGQSGFGYWSVLETLLLAMSRMDHCARFVCRMLTCRVMPESVQSL